MKVKYTIEEMREFLSKQSIIICSDSKTKLKLIKENDEFLITENNHVVFRCFSDEEALNQFKYYAGWE